MFLRPKLLFSILAALLMLSACSEKLSSPTSPVAPIPQPTPQPTPQPGPNPNVLGVMEISFERLGSSQIASSAQRVNTELDTRLDTQSLDEQGQGVDLKLKSNGAFSDSVNGERYVYATYDVRNAAYCPEHGSCPAYTTARDNLTFLAVATTQTVNGSALARLERFDGSPADASIALDVVPTHGMTSGLNVDDSLADMQVFSEAELSLFTPAGPSVTSVLPYGFVTRNSSSTTSRTLPANPAVDQFDGQVTFALKLPLQSDPADDPYKISLMVLVVDDSNTRVTESLEEQGAGNAESRADALTAAGSSGAEVALFGNSGSSPTDNATTRICRVRTAGTANNPTALLFNETTGVCTPTPPAINDFAHDKVAALGEVDETITFTWDVEATEGDPVTCAFNMGDGTVYGIENCHDTSSLTHSYSSADIYTVQLTAVDDDGLSQDLSIPTIASFDPNVYNVDVIFDPDSDWTPQYINVFKSAAERWSEVITGDLPADLNFDEPEYVGDIDDLVITAAVVPIDGVNGILGQAGPIFARNNPFLPSLGEMRFDIADMAALASGGTLENVILHEMGHVIGIGTFWFVVGIDENNHTYPGANGIAEYSTLTGNSENTVPIEDTGGPGTINSHWDESTFVTELMTSSISSNQTTAASSPLARLTIGSLDDLGYTVDYNAADPYTMPGGPNLRAPAGKTLPHSIPTVLRYRRKDVSGE